MATFQLWANMACLGSLSKVLGVARCGAVNDLIQASVARRGIKVAVVWLCRAVGTGRLSCTVPQELPPARLVNERHGREDELTGWAHRATAAQRSKESSGGRDLDGLLGWLWRPWRVGTLSQWENRLATVGFIDGKLGRLRHLGVRIAFWVIPAGLL